MGNVCFGSAEEEKKFSAFEPARRKHAEVDALVKSGQGATDCRTSDGDDDNLLDRTASSDNLSGEKTAPLADVNDVERKEKMDCRPVSAEDDVSDNSEPKIVKDSPALLLQKATGKTVANTPRQDEKESDISLDQTCTGAEERNDDNDDDNADEGQVLQQDLYSNPFAPSEDPVYSELENIEHMSPPPPVEERLLAIEQQVLDLIDKTDDAKISLSQLPKSFESEYSESINHKELGHKKLKALLNVLSRVEVTCSDDRNEFFLCRRHGVPKKDEDLLIIQDKILDLIGEESVPLSRLRQSFRSKYNEDIDYQKLGHKRLKALLAALPKVSVIGLDGKNDSFVCRNHRFAEGSANKGASEARTPPPLQIDDNLLLIEQKILSLVDKADSARIPLYRLDECFRKEYNANVNYEKLGFKKMKALLLALPEVSVVGSGGGRHHYVCRRHADLVQDTTEKDIAMTRRHNNGARNEETTTNRKKRCDGQELESQNKPDEKEKTPASAEQKKEHASANRNSKCLFPDMRYIDPPELEDSTQRLFDPFVVILVGLPGSGKSTWCRKLQEIMPWKYCVVNQDELGNRKKCVARAKRILNEGKCPIIDRTNVSRKHREHFIGLLDRAKQIPCQVDCVVFDLSQKECLRRCKLRHHHPKLKPSLAPKVIKAMLSEWEFPAEDEDFRSIRRIQHARDLEDALKAFAQY